jgi:hypothetical protein
MCTKSLTGNAPRYLLVAVVLGIMTLSYNHGNKLCVCDYCPTKPGVFLLSAI